MSNLISKLITAMSLERQATAGPWRWSENLNIMAPGNEDVDEIAAVYTERDDDLAPANAKFILASVDFVRQLISEFELATKSNESTIESSNEWHVHCENGNVYICSSDFSHDASMAVQGDFFNLEARVKYAEELVEKLNMQTSTKERSEGKW